ncbi:Protein FAM200A [Larimichthys crocea]|nr:Protein FAM200A [Larimichthys crocea]
MWLQRVKVGRVDSFENLKSFIEDNKLQNTVIPCMEEHISALQKHFQRYFLMQDPKQYDWIRDPFSASPPADLSTPEEEQFIDVTSDSTLRLQFQSKTLAAFWIGVEKQYPLLGKRALATLLPFATSYLCEIGFSAVASIKTKYRSKMDIENELRVAISKLPPRFEKICSMKQAHTSH